MKITGIRAIPLSDPIPEERQHRTDLGTKVKSDSVGKAAMDAEGCKAFLPGITEGWETLEGVAKERGLV